VTIISLDKKITFIEITKAFYMKSRLISKKKENKIDTALKMIKVRVLEWKDQRN